MTRMLKANQLARKKEIEKNAAIAHLTDLTTSLRDLVNSKGYSYAKSVAYEICKEFECRPTDPNWMQYTTIKYALETLFHRIERGATKSPKDVEAYADHGRNSR